MRGIIFNLLADLARRAHCEDDAWHVALAVSEEVAEELSLDEEDEAFVEEISEEMLQGGANFTFRWLLRSGGPFRDEDWSDFMESAPSAEPQRGSEPPGPLLTAFAGSYGRRRPNKL
jgi:hypothetical protein